MEEAYLTVAAGANGGGWYIMGAAFNDAWEQNLPVHMTLIPGGGSSNPALVNDGTDVQIGFTYVATAASAVKGQFEFDGAPCADMVALGSLNIKQYLTINTTADFTSVEDMIANPKSLKLRSAPARAATKSCSTAIWKPPAPASTTLRPPAPTCSISPPAKG